MDDLVGVHIVAGTNKLNHEEAGLGLCKDTTTVKHVHEGAAGAKLEGHVYVFFILEAVYESNDVGVV